MFLLWVQEGVSEFLLSIERGDLPLDLLKLVLQTFVVYLENNVFTLYLIEFMLYLLAVLVDQKILFLKALVQIQLI